MNLTLHRMIKYIYYNCLMLKIKSKIISMSEYKPAKACQSGK